VNALFLGDKVGYLTKYNMRVSWEGLCVSTCWTCDRL